MMSLIDAGNNLTNEQNNIVNHQSKNGLMTVKGCAGSGKTAVILTRMIKTANESDDSIIYLTYTQSMMTYVREILEYKGIDKNRIKVSTVDSFIMEIYRDMNDAPRVDVLNDETTMHMYMQMAIEELKKYPEIKWPDKFDKISYQFWVEECLWMSAMEV